MSKPDLANLASAKCAGALFGREIPGRPENRSENRSENRQEERQEEQWRESARRRTLKVLADFRKNFPG
jgi:hypothetical protein